MRIYRCLMIGLVSAICLAGGLGCQNHQRELQLRAGYELLDQRQYDQALSAADAYLAENPAGPGTAEAMYLRGRAIEQRVKHSDAEAITNFREARGVYEQALQLNGSRRLQGYLYTSLGNVCFWLDDYAAAESYWGSAGQLLESDDLKAWVLYRVGICQQRQGKWGTADQTFAGIQQAYPGTEAAQRAGAHRGAREFYVQVAAFQNPQSADKLIFTLRNQGFPAVRMAKPEKHLQLVMAGPLPDYRRAASMRDRLSAAGYKDVLIVP